MLLHLVTVQDPDAALGLAVRMTMQHPAFARQPFGEWAEVLLGQARRGHQVFVMDEQRELRGFFGYALTSAANGRAWALEKRALRYEDCLGGECLIINAWISADAAALRLMLQAARQLGQDKQIAYFRRVYPDGEIRTSRLHHTPFIARHLARSAAVPNLPEAR